tara:strand:- start:804 stop:1682 length:879 start_codon:yes stop_codon:yes gene_type:complete
MEELKTNEKQELQKHETTIKKGLNTFVEVGQALLEIRDKKLYRIEYNTFEEYCKQKWQISRRRSYQLIEASLVIENVNPGTQMPKNEKEIRPLTSLEPEIQNAVWQETIEKHGENITAKKVQEVANDWKEASKEIKQQKNEGVFVAANDKDILKKAKEIKEQKAAEYKQKIVERIENKVSQTEISQEEQDLIDKLSQGKTIVININKHFHVLKEAKERGLYFQIDRFSGYGNPFFLDSDGDREQVCDGYIEYFKHKRSLHNKVKELKGKALGCHCAPLRCHGDHLKSLADEN